jgi:hypothetical protein
MSCRALRISSSLIAGPFAAGAVAPPADAPPAVGALDGLLGSRPPATLSEYGAPVALPVLAPSVLVPPPSSPPLSCAFRLGARRCAAALAAACTARCSPPSSFLKLEKKAFHSRRLPSSPSGAMPLEGSRTPCSMRPLANRMVKPSPSASHRLTAPLTMKPGTSDVDSTRHPTRCSCQTYGWCSSS